MACKERRHMTDLQREQWRMTAWKLTCWQKKNPLKLIVFTSQQRKDLIQLLCACNAVVIFETKKPNSYSWGQVFSRDCHLIVNYRPLYSKHQNANNQFSIFSSLCFASNPVSSCALSPIGFGYMKQLETSWQSSLLNGDDWTFSVTPQDTHSSYTVTGEGGRRLLFFLCTLN